MTIKIENKKPKTSAKVLGEYKQNSEEWLNARKSGIGGSDVGKICGVSKFGTSLAIWMDKTGRKQKQEENEYMEMGHVMEPVIADLFKKNVDLNGLKLITSDNLFQHPEHDFMLANVDRLIVDNDYKVISFLECKNVSEWRREEFEQGLPSDYILQIQHYMAVLDVDYCYIAYLVGGNHFAYQRIERDNDLINEMIEVEKDFWQLVVTDKMPANITENDSDNLSMLYEKSKKTRISIVDDEIKEIFNQYTSKKEELKLLEKDVEILRNNIVAVMQENEEAISDNYLFIYSPVRGFSEDKLKTSFSDIYKQYLKQVEVLDVDLLKKENIKAYDLCVDTKYRKLTYKKVLSDKKIGVIIWQIIQT